MGYVITPTRDGYVKKLEELIRSEWDSVDVPYQKDAPARPEHCYLNVKDYITRKGGHSQTGWLVLKSESVYEAIAHAVVEPEATPDEFIDVTPFDELSGKWRLFIPDDRTEWLGRPIPSHRLCHTGKTIDMDFVRMCNTLDRIRSKTLYPDDTNSTIADDPIIDLMERVFILEKIPKMKERIKLVRPQGRCYCGSGNQYAVCHSASTNQMLQSASDTLDALERRITAKTPLG